MSEVTFTEWTPANASEHINVPVAADDKYSRGVLGVVTGSADYPGAAVLGVEAALGTGVGMVRYLGPERPTNLVLQRRPEIVAVNGRVQAWLLGSGIDASNREESTSAQLADALAQGLPTVLDAGALNLLPTATGPIVLTPHFGELARVLDVDKAEISGDPAAWAVRAAEQLGVTVLLKGAETFVADPYGSRYVVSSSNGWTATAGSGDALGGILGALVATHSQRIAADERMLARLAATASVLHRSAAAEASGGGPFTVLALAARLPAVVARLVGL